MNSNLLNRIENILKSEHYSMNKTWLKECMEYFIHSEINNRDIVDKDLLKFIKTQWQLSDLREINNNNGSLPQRLNEYQCTTLHGTYILQLEKIYDISTSKYKQLEEIRNVSTSNIEATKDDPTESDFKSWELRKKRMLQLYLTDGIQNISAIEYKPIHSLNAGLLPGYKVMIIGPVKCRRGIILLEEGKFREIGGEVESLLIPNALENVLARALNCPENPDPYNDNQQKDDERDKVNFQDDITEEEIAQIEQFEETNNRLQNQRKTSNTRNQLSSSSISHASNNSNNERNEQSYIIEALSEDDELLQWVDESQFVEPSVSNIDNNIGKKKKDSEEPSRVLCKTSSAYENEDVIITKDDGNEDYIEFSADEFDDIDMSEIQKVECTIDKQKSLTSHESFSSKSQFQVISKEQKPFGNKDKSYPSSELSAIRINDAKGSSFKNCCQSNTPGEIGNKRTAASISPPTSVSSPKIRCISEASTSKKMSDYMVTIPKQIVPEKICDFICDVRTEIVKETTVKCVRAQVSALGKLSKKKCRWQLEGTIIDKTGDIDVSFASEVLESFLGYTVQKFVEQKREAKTDPKIEHKLRMRCREAEQKLKDLDALLQLELKPDQKPVVVNVKPLSDQQKEIIEQMFKMRQM